MHVVLVVLVPLESLQRRLSQVHVVSTASADVYVCIVCGRARCIQCTSLIVSLHVLWAYLWYVVLAMNVIPVTNVPVPYVCIVKDFQGKLGH